tara:strand:+ start:1622 stop:2659 length:1038 start_codon:yes stop_codon:yes gene_type:complete
MNIFFASFLKVLGLISAILFLLLILAGITKFSSVSEEGLKYNLIEGELDAENQIAILELKGPIFNTNNNNNFFSFNAISPKKIRKIFSNLSILKPDVLLIKINSPGGTVSASNEVYQIIKKFNNANDTKIYFIAKEILASGAYWVAQSGDRIYANYGTLIGSIGVRSPDWIYFDNPISISTGIIGQSIETKNGIKVFSQSAGDSKDIFNPFRKPTNKELEHLKNLSEEIYNDFLNLISKNRKIEKNILRDEIGALIFNTKAAQNNFLIDKTINIDELINLIILDNNFKNYKVIEILYDNLSFFQNFIYTLLIDFENIPVTKSNLCESIKTQFTSILPYYSYSCLN